MSRFEKRFVHFMWDEELEGKEVFYAEYIGYLEDAVENNSLYSYGICNGQGNRDFPFLVNGILRKFVYHDPYYDLKLAREKGKIIQFKDSYGEWTDIEGDYTFSFASDRYRITPEVEERVTRRVGIDDLPIGTKLVIEVVPFEDTCKYCIVKEHGNCEEVCCTASSRSDHKDVYFKLVEVKEP